MCVYIYTHTYTHIYICILKGKKTEKLFSKHTIQVVVEKVYLNVSNKIPLPPDRGVTGPPRKGLTEAKVKHQSKTKARHLNSEDLTHMNQVPGHHPSSRRHNMLSQSEPAPETDHRNASSLKMHPVLHPHCSGNQHFTTALTRICQCLSSQQAVKWTLFTDHSCSPLTPAFTECQMYTRH